MAQVLVEEAKGINTERRLFEASYGKYFNGLASAVYNTMVIQEVPTIITNLEKANLLINQKLVEILETQKNFDEIFNLYSQGRSVDDANDIADIEDTISKSPVFQDLKNFIDSPQEVMKVAQEIVDTIKSDKSKEA